MRAAPLTAEAFAPFGTLIRHGGANGRHHLPEALAARPGFERPAVWVNRLAVAAWPVQAVQLERHPHGAQSFAPLGAGEMLVIVCGADPSGAPDPGALRAFVAPPGTGVCYHPGVWHHGLLAVDDAFDVLVIMAAHGVPSETEHAVLAAPVAIAAPD
ncbi:ureidoglycolate lyase [Methylobrevis albus]|uniref:Ureidoglycolate lyase n=1 Tax=Methylobrevis albus TaxID=2793297 RepID=A0A931I313_9HYPH|nr:ureidoglycolate lyase [Methylobrevis albus]MBH0238351.1 ureidoglycolate lyase [Methylobrevis albus]